MKTLLVGIVTLCLCGCQYGRQHGINTNVEVDPDVRAHGNRTSVTTIDYIPINIFFNGNVLSHVVNSRTNQYDSTIPTNAIPPYYTQNLKQFVELIKVIEKNNSKVYADEVTKKALKGNSK